MDATLPPSPPRAEQLAREMTISAGTIDDLNALMRAMMKSALERMLDAEMHHHSAASRTATRSMPAPAAGVVPDDEPTPPPVSRPNRRNGRSQKAVQGASDRSRWLLRWTAARTWPGLRCRRPT